MKLSGRLSGMLNKMFSARVSGWTIVRTTRRFWIFWAIATRLSQRRGGILTRWTAVVFFYLFSCLLDPRL